ncbi:Eco57I restriction-modification methylase domain-containing protein [Paenibacillus massiliensis]|uniref:Eco57I restriction-modification methylase domain-containing protein n=1 Tax=Paenibacillus massiliensis TaxID=225917 RepID=UPI000424B693|nr:N-6 DNA methylase [Paenibacillus massiliensis]
MNKKCQVFTPVEAVKKLLEVVGYEKDLFGKRIIENACGDGNILTVIVERYITDCLEQGLSLDKIKLGLQNDIFGAELDEGHYRNCINNLNIIAEKYGLDGVNWSILNVDILKEEFDFKFDYVVGNPPYITYKDLDEETRCFVRESYEVCKEGKFDYCYAFIEASLKLLNENGKISYLIPSSIFKNVFAHNLRVYLLPFLNQVYDYQTIKLFDVLTSSAIIVCDKGNVVEQIEYINLDKRVSYKINKANLINKWEFVDKKKSIQGKVARFGDYFNASITIATLLNEAFVLKNFKEIRSFEENGQKYIQTKDFIIEENLLKTAVSPRSLSYNKKEFIIFPYLYNQGSLVRYTQEEFEKKFPFGTRYLKSFFDKLQNRASDKNVKWFEYGRTQALAHLNQEKLLVSTVVTKQVKLYDISKQDIPYSGIYITKKTDLGLDFAKRVLESNEFFEYANSIGINASGSSFRITAKDINNYLFNIEEV